MSETLSANNVTFFEDAPIPASGAWQFSAPSVVHYRTTPPSEMLRDASIALVLAISPVTFGFDPWFSNRMERSATTVSVVQRPSTRRRITILQARQMALEVLVRAEEARRQFAEAEAQHGIDWEHQS